MDMSELDKFEHKVGVLKLSEAIRIGAKLRPQGFGCAFKDGKSCAWGAAWEGIGHPYDIAISYVDILGSSDEWSLANFEVHSVALLNDCNTSREEIADMLEAKGY